MFPSFSRRRWRCRLRLRAALATSLFESLDEGPADQGVEAAWSEEVKRRIEDIDSGKVQMIPYEEVRRRLAALLSDASK